MDLDIRRGLMLADGTSVPPSSSHDWTSPAPPASARRYLFAPSRAGRRSWPARSSRPRRRGTGRVDGARSPPGRPLPTSTSSSPTRRSRRSGRPPGRAGRRLGLFVQADEQPRGSVVLLPNAADRTATESSPDRRPFLDRLGLQTSDMPDADARPAAMTPLPRPADPVVSHASRDVRALVRQRRPTAGAAEGANRATPSTGRRPRGRVALEPGGPACCQPAWRRRRLSGLRRGGGRWGIAPRAAARSPSGRR